MNYRILISACLITVSAAVTTVAQAATTKLIDFETSGGLGQVPFGMILSFANTTPLGTQYLSKGVYFGAQNGGIGGTVMSEESFIAGGYNASSGSHYYAFVNGAVYSNGLVANSMPVLVFPEAISSVSAYIAGALMIALDENFKRIGYQRGAENTPHELDFVKVDSAVNNIKYVGFYTRQGIGPLILDDLTFTRLDPSVPLQAVSAVPLPAGVWLIASGLLGLTGRRFARAGRQS